MPANAVIRVRRDPAANWTSANPVLALGEIGYETDTFKLKVGDGTTAWSGLSYTTATTSTSGTITATGYTMATNKLLGRSTAGTGAIQEIGIGTGLSLSGGTLSSTAGVADGDKGDVVVSGGGTSWTVESAAGAFDILGGTWSAVSAGKGKISANATQGVLLSGNGSTYDIALVGASGGIALYVDHATLQVGIPGSLNVASGGIYTSGGIGAAGVLDLGVGVASTYVSLNSTAGLSYITSKTDGSITYQSVLQHVFQNAAGSVNWARITSLAATFYGDIICGTGKASFGSSTRQMIDLYGSIYGIGIQASTQYYRTNGAFAWFRGGVHSDTAYDPGAGGTLAASLDGSSNFRAEGNLSAYGALIFGGALASAQTISSPGFASGRGNIAIGLSSQAGTPSGVNGNNVSVGQNALQSATTARYNVALGNGAMLGTTAVTGEHNVAIGLNASSGVTSGSYNVAVGSGTGSAGTSASANTLLGYSVASGLTIGGSNVVVGFGAGANLVDGGTNILIGRDAGGGIVSGTGNVVIGYATGGLASGLANNIILKNGAGQGAVFDGTNWGFNGSVGASNISGSTSGTNTGDQFTSVTASKLLGRTSASAGPAQEITLGSGLSMSGTTLNVSSGTATLADGDYGDITVSGTGTVMTIDAGVVTLAKMANMATSSLIYRKTAGTGAPEVQTLATLKTDLGLTGTNSGDQTITLTGDVTGSGTGSFATTVGKINGVALSGLATGILKNTTTTGVPSIAVAADFPTLNQNTTGSAATLTTGRTIGMTGDVTWTSASFNGSSNVSGTSAIGNNVVTDAMLRTGAAYTVIGRAGSTTGNVADIAAADLTVLRRSGTSLAFGAVDLSTAMVTGRLPYANLTASTAASKLLGRTSASAGDWQEITLGTNLSMSGTTLNATGGGGSGSITASGYTENTGTLLGRTTAAAGAIEEITPGATLTFSAGALGVAKVPNAATFNTTGGAAAGTTFDGSAARTIDYSTVGAAKTGAVTGSGLTMATGSLLYRKTAATGAIEEQSLATLKTDLGLTGTNSGDQTITLTGNVTGSGTGSFATTIAAGVVTLGMQANLAANSIVGNNTGSAATPLALTVAQVKAMLAPAIQTPATNAASITPTFADDEVILTGHTVAIAFANPTGAAVEGKKIILRIKDNGTARAITYGTQYRAIGVTLPTTTVINKTLYIGMIFNNTDTKWDVVGVNQE